MFNQHHMLARSTNFRCWSIVEQFTNCALYNCWQEEEIADVDRSWTNHYRRFAVFKTRNSAQENNFAHWFETRRAINRATWNGLNVSHLKYKILVFISGKFLTKYRHGRCIKKKKNQGNKIYFLVNFTIYFDTNTMAEMFILFFFVHSLSLQIYIMFKQFIYFLIETENV